MDDLVEAAQGMVDLTASEYRRLARAAAEHGLRAPSGPVGDRYVAAGQVFALCALSAPEEEDRG